MVKRYIIWILFSALNYIVFAELIALSVKTFAITNIFGRLTAHLDYSVK